MNKYKIECRMNMPSHYQADFYRELNKKCDLKVTFESELSKERKALGWESNNIGFESNYDNDIKRQKENVNLLSGMPGSIRNIKIAMKGKTLFQCEMPYYHSDKKFILKSVFFSKFLNFYKIPFLGIGEKIRYILSKYGLNKELIYPFAYFVKKNNDCNIKINNPLVYSGQLIKRKRIDLLIKVFSDLKFCRNKGLVIIGNGEEKNNLKNYCNKLGVQDEVKFTGQLSINEINKYYCNSSCLILPSEHDGWGVVVNEAINSGLPVITSDRCGAKELIENGDTGYIFENGSYDSLKQCLQKLFNSESNYYKIQSNCINYSEKISPKMGADYLVRIIDYYYNNSKNHIIAKPVAPWLKLKKL